MRTPRQVMMRWKECHTMAKAKEFSSDLAKQEQKLAPVWGVVQ